MVTIRFTKKEIQEVLLWGSNHKEMQTRTGMKWDDDQEIILQKLKESVK